MAKKHALLIANTEYRDSKLSPLAHPGLAYADLADALKDPARGAFSHVETLVNANLSHVLNTLDRFFSRKPADDILLVYVGGHGFVDVQGELFLALKESDRFRLKSTALMAAVLGMNMDQCPSPHKLLILDCHFHSPYQDSRGSQAELKVDPAKVFAGRGLPKLILSSGESQGGGPRPAATAPTSATQKLQVVTPKDFTRTLAETLRTPSSVPGGRSAFTVEDWWQEVAAELKSTRAEAPVRHTIGMPPLTVLRGASLPRPELAMSMPHGETSVTMPIMNPDADMDWSRLSGIFPLEMFAPGMAGASNPPSEPPAGELAGEDPPEEEIPTARTLQMQMPRGDETIIAGAGFIEGGDANDLFATMRARLVAQEEEDKQAGLTAEREEAAQQAKLEQWKARWEKRAGETSDHAGAPPKENAGASPYVNKITALQKTMFIGNPYGEDDGEDQPQPRPELTEINPVQGSGLDTVAVPKDQFLNTGSHKILTPMTPGATIMVPKDQFYETGTGAMEAEGSDTQVAGASLPARPLRPVRGERKTVSLPKTPRKGSGGGNPSKLALWILAALVPVGLGLFVFFGVKSDLFGDLGFGEELPDVRVAPPRITPVTPPPRPAAPALPTAEDLNASPSTEAAPIGSPVPDPAPAFTAVPAAAPVAATKAPVAAAPARPARVASTPTEQESERLARSKFRNDSLRADRVRQDSLMTVRAQAKQDSIAIARLMKDADRAAKAESRAAQLAVSKFRQDSIRMVKDAVRAESTLRNAVNQALKADTEELRGLYNRFALGYPGLKGEVVVVLRIAPDGEIERGTIQSSTTGLKMFDQMVLGNVLEWRIQPFKGPDSKTIAVAIPFPVDKP